MYRDQINTVGSLNCMFVIGWAACGSGYGDLRKIYALQMAGKGHFG